MENVKNDIIEDAILLCDKAIRTRNDCDTFKKGYREISIEGVKAHEFQIMPDESVLYYKYSDTPDRLKEAGVIDYSWFADIDNVYKSKSRGYHQIKFNYDNAEKWIKQEKNKRIKGQKQNIIIPDGKDHEYKNGILYVALQNKDYNILDLTNSPMVKPIFDSFYNLYKNSTTPFFSEIELLNEYKINTNEEIEWSRFVEGVSDIKKRINKKEALKQRIVLEFDKKEQKYRFEILPLSSSDN